MFLSEGSIDNEYKSDLEESLKHQDIPLVTILSNHVTNTRTDLYWVCITKPVKTKTTPLIPVAQPVNPCLPLDLTTVAPPLWGKHKEFSDNGGLSP